MRRFLALLLLGALALAPAQAETEADRWNLADLHPSVAAWNTDAAKPDTQLPELAACRGRLGDSAARLRQCLDLQTDISKRLSRMFVFASEQLSEDTGAGASQELIQKAQLLYQRIRQTASFIDPELLALGAERIARFVAAEPALQIYRFPLERTLRAAPHTLDDAAEALVARFGLMDGSASSAYSLLANADIP